MEDIYFIETIEQLKVISEPLRIQILWELDEGPKTGKMVADDLELPPSKVRYHIKELEKAGLIQLVKTEEKNGILQKFYQPVAKEISLEKIIPKVNKHVEGYENLFRENGLVLLDKTKSILRKMEGSNLKFDFMWFEDVWLNEEELSELKAKIKDVSNYLRGHRTKRQETERYHISALSFPYPEAEEE
ncbi:MAG TPA: winged helix-turn-helix domain-containing protein [Bacillales bacterium]|nr:winged helix-turn-helix domain-containing protein [Bacillales bacterium]